MCALEQDLAMLPAGADTEIGEKARFRTQMPRGGVTRIGDADAPDGWERMARTQSSGG